MNPLEGKQIRYLIGGDDDYAGDGNEVIELSYDATSPPSLGIAVKYGNLFNEKYSEQSAAERACYAPYLEPGDTASEYNEGQIDPDGQGWDRNLHEQFTRANEQGFAIIELDNPDSYDMDDVIDAVSLAEEAGLLVMAKNPLICSGDPVAYVGHPAVVGVVVERDCGVPEAMDELRQDAGKATLPVWFVAFGGGRSWAERMASQIETGGYRNMGVTFSSEGEYENSIDVLLPKSEPSAAKMNIKTSGNVRVILNGQVVAGS